MESFGIKKSEIDAQIDESLKPINGDSMSGQAKNEQLTKIRKKLIRPKAFVFEKD